MSALQPLARPHYAGRMHQICLKFEGEDTRVNHCNKMVYHCPMLALVKLYMIPLDLFSYRYPL